MKLSLFVASLLLISIFASGRFVQSGETESITKTLIKTENVKLKDGSVVEVNAYLKNEGSASKPACRVTIKYKPQSSSGEGSVMVLDCGEVDNAMSVLQQFKPWIKDKAAKLNGKAGA
jgi:hypothetical protein